MDRKEDHNKERLKDVKKDTDRQHICVNCKNNLFYLWGHVDFPYFDAICSKCGCIDIVKPEL